MAQSLFPRRRSESEGTSAAQYIALEEAEGLLNALATETGRQILAVLHEDALPTSEIADAVGTSIQNITYHLSRLEAAGIVDTVDTWYSSRGREMDVYAVTADPLVFCIGDLSDGTIAGGGSERGDSDSHEAEFTSPEGACQGWNDKSPE